MVFIENTYTGITYRCDGARVWWWSSNLGVWFPDVDNTPERLDHLVQSVHGRLVDDPENKE